MQKLTKNPFIADSTHGKLVKLNPPGFIYFRYSCTCVYLDMSIGEYACLYLNVCVSYDQEIKLHLFYNVKYTSDFSLDLSLE